MDDLSGHASEGYIDSAEELRIFHRVWRPAGQARAAVAICHGFNAHSGHYAWAASKLAQAGFAVYALDLRGRGHSDGERYFVENIGQYVSDLGKLVDVAERGEPGLPLFLLGHSAGGVVSCLYALDHGDRLAGLICESFAFRVPAPDFVLAVLKGLSHIAPHAHVLKLKNEDFSRDPSWIATLNADPLIENEVQPTQTVAALVRADEQLEADFAKIGLPLLIMHGTADKATRTDGSRTFHESAGSDDKTLKLYDGHFHDLLNDLGREKPMADIVGWIGDRLSSG